jgi:hypothetical protein
MIKPSKIGQGGERTVAILLVLFVGAAAPMVLAADGPQTVDFQREVRPILSDACFDCHGPDAKARKAHLRFDVSDGGIFEDRDGGKVVEPGKPGETMMVMAELPKPPETYVLIRGKYDKKGEKVGPTTPVSLPPLPASAPRNRLGLAAWLVDPRNPLTARVAVNRFWQSYFGVGLVRTARHHRL